MMTREAIAAVYAQGQEAVIELAQAFFAGLEERQGQGALDSLDLAFTGNPFVPTL